jgi:methyltransferase (TIGR00027 family)
MEDGGPSATARQVAAHRLGFTRVATDYGDPAADEALAADVVDGLVVPAGRMHDYLAARTSFFDRTVTSAIDRGGRQVVVGAAGYDGRSLRYAKPGVRWFEVDHPATQRDKLARLKRLGIDAAGVRFVEADFTRDPLAARLRAAGLDPGAPSLFLLEGIAVYLEPAVLENVLDQFREVAAPGSQLAISVSTSRPAEGIRARFQAAVAAVGEPARSFFEAGQAEDLLARTGWPVAAAGGKAHAGRKAHAGGKADSDERRRTAGLLTATAGPRAARDPSAAAGPRSARDPASASGPRPAAQPRRAAPSRSPAPQSSQPPQEGPLPLSALLSQALVAFTIEFDNEAEHNLPHRTTNHGPSRTGDGAWLVSLVMYENCMRYVAEEPLTVGELLARARTGTNLDGMRRWGYVTIDGTAKKIHKGNPGPDAVLRATAAGLRARQIWEPLPALVERRWRDRFGADQVARLRDALVPLVRQLDPGLPDCLPILPAGLRSQIPVLPPRPDPAEPGDPAGLPLPALLARVLLSFAIEYESEAGQSLAAGATVLRVLGEAGTRLRDLPSMAGISKEAVSWALGVLTRSGLAAEEPDPAARRGRVARLTSQGQRAQHRYHELTAVIERRWRDRFGAETPGAIRAALEPLATAPDGELSPLFGGMRPYPDNWRAQVRPPVTLPHYPMVLHRGGYPDGS